MTKALLALTVTMAAFVATPTFAQQNRNCGERQSVVTRLAERYGESRQSIGLAPNNSVVEVFASEETGTWTITVTMVNGITCLVASGNAFETLAEALPNTDSDA